MKNSPFKFPVAVAVHVDALLKLMAYANSREDGMWANQSSSKAYDGVYGSAATTLQNILRGELKNYLPSGLCGPTSSEIMEGLAEIAPADIVDLVEVVQATINLKHHQAATADSIC